MFTNSTGTQIWRFDKSIKFNALSLFLLNVGLKLDQEFCVDFRLGRDMRLKASMNHLCLNPPETEKKTNSLEKTQL